MEDVNTTQQHNPLIEKARSTMPGTTYRLPSRGVFYEDTNILRDDVDNGEVVVYQMRLREELAMKSTDAIFQGTAVTDTIRYCVPQVLDPMRLVSEDVDYLLTVIKKQSHGNTITYRDACFDEERLKKLQKQEQEKYKNAAEEMAKREMDDSSREDDYKINEDETDPEAVIQKMYEAEQELNGQDGEESEGMIEIDNGICEFEIPITHFLNTCKPVNPETVESNMVFEFENFLIRSKPLTFEDIKNISLLRLEDQENMSTGEFVEFATKFSNENISRRLARVDDIEDPEIIYEWVESLSLDQRTKLYDKLSEGMGWGIDFTYTIECPKCGKSKETDQSYLNPLYFFLTS